MSTPKELNNWIEQQENSKKSNHVMNMQAKVIIERNNELVALLEAENDVAHQSTKLRMEQDSFIDESVLAYKKMIRNGEYGKENKDMKFVDEE